MDRYIHNDDFDKDVIYDKMKKLSKELKEEEEKGNDKRIGELIYAQWIQGLKLSVSPQSRLYNF